MDLTGVIFGAIAVAWLAYLVPMFLARRGGMAASESEPVSQLFSPMMRQVHGDDDEIDGELEVSTPLTRRFQIRRLNQVAARAAARRRRALLMLLATTITLVVTSVLGHTYWWSVAFPVAGVVGFVLYSRVLVCRERVVFNRVADEIAYGDDEPTICLDLHAFSERSVELTAPIEFTGSLWDPVPVTAPTYVQKPLVSRTVRTIDLSAPDLAAQNAFPPTADRPVRVEQAAPEQVCHDEVTEDIVVPRAVGQ